MRTTARKLGLAGLLEHIDHEARQEGPTANGQLNALDRYYSLFGQFLELRRAKGWTQEQLAQASGIPQAEISRIEQGKANPTAQTMVALVAALDGDIRLHRRSVRA